MRLNAEEKTTPNSAAARRNDEKECPGRYPTGQRKTPTPWVEFMCLPECTRVRSAVRTRSAVLLRKLRAKRSQCVALQQQKRVAKT